MKRLREFIDFNKEERWLNEMAQGGQLLVKKRFRYHFRPLEPGAVVVRVDYRDRRMSAVDFDDYLTLFADAGWQHLDGTRAGGAQYFAAFAVTPDADIFSDSASRAARYRRSIAYRGAVALPLLVIFFALLAQGSLPITPAEWYLTPGLWNMQGREFVARFLFETPFVLFRVASPVLLIGVCLLPVVQMVVQYRLYRRAKGLAGSAS